MSKFATDYTSSPVCPHCEEKYEHDWELDLSDGDTEEIECANCGKPYRVTRHISIDYSTEKTDNPPQGEKETK